MTEYPLHEEAVRAEVGKGADLWLYKREHRTPMSFVLEEAERQLKVPVLVFWMDQGPPMLSSYPGMNPPTVVFSSRYLSLCAFVRHLLAEDCLLPVLPDVSERTCLKVMAEMALRYSDPDFAVLAFAKSLVGKGIWLNDDDRVMQLEYEPIAEPYMCTWFYGLLHEIGHCYAKARAEALQAGHLSDEALQEALEVALHHMRHYPHAIRATAMQEARNNRASVLYLDTLRMEGVADSFAASVLLKATTDIMQELGVEFQMMTFLAELAIFTNIIALLDRCRRIAALASIDKPMQHVLNESAFHPVSMMVRALVQRVYLEKAATAYAYGDRATDSDRERVSSVIADLHRSMSERLDPLEIGLANAMEFCLLPERRPSETDLIEHLKQDLQEDPLAKMEVQRFLALADVLGRDGHMLRLLGSIAADSPV